MSIETWITNCEECNTPIDRLDQDKGIYFVGGGQSLCSEKCVKKVLGKETFKQAQEEWEFDGDSDLYYWTYFEEKEQVFDENDFTLVKSITQGENLFEHKNGCLYIVEYEEVDDEEIHDFDNPTLYMDKEGTELT